VTPGLDYRGGAVRPSTGAFPHPDPRPGTVRCADCDWTVAAVEAVAWRELAMHRGEEHDESAYESRESDANRGRMGGHEAAPGGASTPNSEGLAPSDCSGKSVPTW